MGATEDWLEGGANATAMITSSLQYADVADPGYSEDLAAVMNGMGRCDLAIANAWLARLAAQAILDKHQGNREKAGLEVQQMGVMILESLANLASDAA